MLNLKEMTRNEDNCYFNMQILLTSLYRFDIVAVGRSCSCNEDNLRSLFKSGCVHARQSTVIVTQSLEKRDSFRVGQRKAPLYVSQDLVIF